MTHYAKIFMLVWQVQHVQQRMRLHAYLCGRLCTCIHGVVADTSCVAEYATTCPACMPGRQIAQCVDACMADYATTCKPVWWVMQWQHGCVAPTTSKAECGRLCNRMCGRSCRSMCANVADNAACTCLCVRLCACMHACVADTTCVAENVTACIPL